MSNQEFTTTTSSNVRDDGPPYGRGEPLLTTGAVRDMLQFLLGSANQRQVWLFHFDENGAIIDPIMPMDGLPNSPDEIVGTSDLGRVTFATVLSDRIMGIMEMIDAASCGLVWERRGSDRCSPNDIAWASDLAHYLAVAGVTLRAQFLLHNDGLRELTTADLSARR